MTIAVCYLSSEGVVLGADSTTTVMANGSPQHFFDHQQKVLEIGEDSTLGLVMWGLGSLRFKSYRTFTAEFSDSLKLRPATSVQEVANRWAAGFWAEYTVQYAALIQRFNDLQRINPRTPDEDNELQNLAGIAGGFCIGGYVLPNRTPAAFSIMFGPALSAPEVQALAPDQPQFWGVPNLMHRLLFGTDDALFNRILQSPFWTGSQTDLFSLIQPGVLKAPTSLPIRDAVDWVNASIYTTIKAIKFSQLPPVCGGPIEIAVITTDRRFRWVKHKRLDEVIRYNSFQGQTP